MLEYFRALRELNFRTVFSGFGAVFSLLILSVIIFFSYFTFKKSSYIHKKDIIIECAKTDYICKLLSESGISANLFVSQTLMNILEYIGYMPKIGEYHLLDHSSLFNALMIFASGKSVVHKFTIPEGFSAVQLIEKLNKDEFLLGQIEKIPEEGSLMPDTYFFCYPATKQKIISMASNEMCKFLRKAWENRSVNCIISSPQDAVTLASIVEKETHIERGKVAGVYMNRLKLNMRLQACPTAIYAITGGAKLNRKLTYSDLKFQHPHNTYRNNGLPPTPICNPSRESILAVLNPDETDCLFFMHDKSHRAFFAKTFEEHTENLKIKKNNELSHKNSIKN